MAQTPSNEHQEESDHPLNAPRHPLEVRSASHDTPPPSSQTQARPKEDRPYLTYLLLFINVAIFLVGYLQPDLGEQFYQAGALYAPYVLRQNEFYRLFTAMFLHGFPAHILMNGIGIYVLGQTLEPLFGRARFLLIYFLGGLAGSILSVTLGDYQSASVGASGALFALVGAELLHYYLHRNFYTRAVYSQFRQLFFLVIFQLGLAFLPGSIIDNWGHIGGLVGGVFLTWFIGPHFEKPSQPIAIKSLHDISQLDSNPLRRHLPIIILYCAVLVGAMIFAINFVGIVP